MSAQGDLFERVTAPAPDDGLDVCPDCGGWCLVCRAVGLLAAGACATCNGEGEVAQAPAELSSGQP